MVTIPSEDFKKVSIKELPMKTGTSDRDIFITSDTIKTYQTSAKNLVNYITDHECLEKKYILSKTIDQENGIPSLDENKKLPGDYLTYGNTSSTVYEGSAGKTLEQNLDAHITDPNPHGLGRVDNTSDVEKPVSYAQQQAISNAYQQAINYANKIKSEIMGGLPDEALDTILELSERLKSESDALNALILQVSEKAKKEDLELHCNDALQHIPAISNTNGTYLKATKDGSEWGNLTNEDIINALGYTPGDETSRIIVDSELSSTSINAVQNKTVTNTLSKKVDRSEIGSSASKDCKDSTTIMALSTSNTIPTERVIYNGLPNINGDHNYNSNTNIYAPLSSGTSGYYLKSIGNGTPVWESPLSLNVGTSLKAERDSSNNVIFNESVLSTEPTNQKIGDYWLLEY